MARKGNKNSGGGRRAAAAAPAAPEAIEEVEGGLTIDDGIMGATTFLLLAAIAMVYIAYEAYKGGAGA